MYELARAGFAGPNDLTAHNKFHALWEQLRFELIDKPTSIEEFYHRAIETAQIIILFVAPRNKCRVSFLVVSCRCERRIAIVPFSVSPSLDLHHNAVSHHNSGVFFLPSARLFSLIRSSSLSVYASIHSASALSLCCHNHCPAAAAAAAAVLREVKNVVERGRRTNEAAKTTTQNEKRRQIITKMGLCFKIKQRRRGEEIFWNMMTHK